MICVLDASVVVALLTSSDAHHAAAGEQVRRRRRSGTGLLLPASVLAEVLVRPHRVGPEHAQQRRGQLLALFRLRPLDEPVADEAARLRARHPSLRLPDALVLATGEVEDAEVLTADARWATYSPRAVVL